VDLCFFSYASGQANKQTDKLACRHADRHPTGGKVLLSAAGCFFRVIACDVRYVENAAFPKDVVILLDRSGSMKGVRLEIARSTVKKILSTLTDDDYFNVITVRAVDSNEFVGGDRNTTSISYTVFLPHDAYATVYAAVARCLSVTRRHCIETSERIEMGFLGVSNLVF